MDNRCAGLINQYQPVVIGTLTRCPHNLYREAHLFHCGEDIDSARFHGRARPFGVAAKRFFDGTLFAEVAGTGTKTKSFPGAAEKNASLEVGDCSLYIRFGLEVYKHCSVVRIEDLAHLFRRRCKGGTDQTAAVTIASEPALERHPGSGFHVGRTNHVGISDLRFLLCGPAQLLVGKFVFLFRSFGSAIHLPPHAQNPIPRIVRPGG